MGLMDTHRAEMRIVLTALIIKALISKDSVHGPQLRNSKHVNCVQKGGTHSKRLQKKAAHIKHKKEKSKRIAITLE